VSRNGWKNVIGVIFIIVFMSLMQFGTRLERKHYVECRMASDSVENILIENGICQKKTGCKAGTYFSGSTFTGFDISIYGIVDQKILQKISTELESQYKKNDENLTVIFRAYSESYELTKDKNPFMEITFKRKKK